MTGPDTQAGVTPAQALDVVTTLRDGRRFVHRDVSALAASLIPPRRVPFGKRLFWSLLLLVLRSGPGRRWVQRRYGA